MRSSYLSRKNSWVPIEKCEPEISINKGSESPSIKRTHFPLILLEYERLKQNDLFSTVKRNAILGDAVIVLVLFYYPVLFPLFPKYVLIKQKIST